jgi:hypothetical protein
MTIEHCLSIVFGKVAARKGGLAVDEGADRVQDIKTPRKWLHSGYTDFRKHKGPHPKQMQPLVLIGRPCRT